MSLDTYIDDHDEDGIRGQIRLSHPGHRTNDTLQLGSCVHMNIPGWINGESLKDMLEGQHTFLRLKSL